jgi:hypothetical protein
MTVSRPALLNCMLIARGNGSSAVRVSDAALVGYCMLHGDTQDLLVQDGAVAQVQSNVFSQVTLVGSGAIDPLVGDRAVLDAADYPARHANDSDTAGGLHHTLTALDDRYLQTIGSTGSTDNAILRANGTGGETIQGSPVTIDDAGTIDLPAGQTYNVDGVPHTHASSGRKYRQFVYSVIAGDLVFLVDDDGQPIFNLLDWE